MFLKKHKLNPSQEILLYDLTLETLLNIEITFFLSDCESLRESSFSLNSQ